MHSNLTEYFRDTDEAIGPFADTEGGAWMCDTCAAEAENVDNNSVTPIEVGHNPNDLDLITTPKCCECGRKWNGGR